MIVISEGKRITAPVIKDKVLRCIGCNASKCSGLPAEELHAQYHNIGGDPLTGWNGKLEG